jgi:hypothetical protein
MNAGTVKAPRFHQGQRVHFVGGTGAVKNYQFGPGYITYQVEMEMGPEKWVVLVRRQRFVYLNQI